MVESEISGTTEREVQAGALTPSITASALLYWVSLVDGERRRGNVDEGRGRRYEEAKGRSEIYVVGATRRGMGGELIW